MMIKQAKGEVIHPCLLDLQVVVKVLFHSSGYMQVFFFGLIKAKNILLKDNS